MNSISNHIGKLQRFSNANIRQSTGRLMMERRIMRHITPIGITINNFATSKVSPVQLGWIRRYHATNRLSNKEFPQFGPEPKPSKFKITKDKLLAQASGPLSRLLIHIKWPLKRNNKPFTIDDVSAFFSWLVMGNVLWIVLGTTTFGLATLYSLHTYESLHNKVSGYFNSDDGEDDNGNNGSGTKRKPRDDGIVAYLTSAILSFGLGIKLNFYKGNVLPEFKDGKLIFKNIEIISIPNEDSDMKFDCHVQSLNLSLSFGKWYDGNGLINDLEIFGMSGKVIKSPLPIATTTNSTINANANTVQESPMEFRRYHDSIHFQYDMNDDSDVAMEPTKRISRIDPNYELYSVRIHDSYIEVFDSDTTDGIKPLKISIFNCEIPKLTGKTLLIDFFNAKNVVGSINNSMFTIHKKQDHNAPNNVNTFRFKLDGIDMGNLTSINPKLRFNWILTGKAEITADIRFPDDIEKEDSIFDYKSKRISEMIGGVINDIANINNDNNSDKTIGKNTENNDDTRLMRGALHAIYETFKINDDDDYHESNKNSDTLSEYVIVNATIKFNNLKATLPKELPLAYSGNVPFITLHDLRSLISYINKLDTDNSPPIVVKTTVIEKLSNLYNFETLTQTKVFDVIISDVYDEFIKLVKLDEERIIEEKSSLWSHSIASQLLLLGLGVIV